MTLFSVDENRCKGEGICVDECPARNIVINESTGLPEPIPGAEEFCINCGHCVVVCPHGAISHRSMSPDECPPVIKELTFNPEHVEHLLRARRSIRTYKKKHVEKEKIERLIHIARYAPSGHNLQPVRWLVIYDSDRVSHLASIVMDWMRELIKQKNPLAILLHMDRLVERWESGNDPICRGAPHVIVTHAQADERTAQPACTIALTYLDLTAPSFGLGTCWAGYFHAASNIWPPMQDALNLPDGHACFGAMMIGYPKYTYHRLPKRNTPQITWI